MPFLKISENVENEAAALRAFNGIGAVQFLELNLAAKTIVMERAEPGNTLKELYLNGQEEESIEIACGIIKLLQQSRASQGSFTDIADFRSSFDLKTDFPQDQEKAKSIFDSLIASTDQKILLHGDLHHENIVRAQRRPWLAIDPKGYWGDPVYEAGCFIRNPMPEILLTENLSQFLIARIHRMAAILNFDSSRVRRWAHVQAVLAALWDIEENVGDGKGWIEIARALE